MEQLLWDFPEVDLRPHQRDQVHFQPLLAGGDELLLLVLRRQEKRLIKESLNLKRPLLDCDETTSALSGVDVPKLFCFDICKLQQIICCLAQGAALV